MVTNLIIMLNNNIDILYDDSKEFPASLLIADSSIDKIGKGTTWGLYDMFISMFSAYMSLVFFPTFATNVVIVIKEMSMNQAAWTVDEDYNQGTFLGIDMNFLELFNVPSRDSYYENWMKAWAHEYL